MFLAPGIYEKLFCGHMVHVASRISPLSVEYFPLAQLAQDADPLTSLNLPGSHAVQFSPSGPVYPKLQTQRDEPSGEYEAKGQEAHVLGDVAFDAVEYVPR